MKTKCVVAVLAIVPLVLTVACAAKPEGRVVSTQGFSFLPPPAPQWREQLRQDEVIYLKQTDPAEVTVYAGALDGKLGAKLDSREALLRFVREKKDQWGVPGRYSGTKTSFAIDEGAPSCVNYDLSTRDHHAKNAAEHDYLLMKVRGRFCLHPQDATSAVDLYYSVRHVPSFEPGALMAEGETFLRSLRFERH